MKRKIILILLLLTIVLISGNITYSYYIRNMHVTIVSTSANVICDAEIAEVENSEKSIYGYSEFKVIVKNYNSSNLLTKEPIKYVLTFEEDNTSNAVFGYNNEFNDNLSINGTISNDMRRYNTHIIQVKSKNGSSQNINYKAKVKCIQDN